MSFVNAIVLGMIDVLAGNFGCALMALGHPAPTPRPEGEGICSLLPRGEGPGMRAGRNMPTRRFHIPP